MKKIKVLDLRSFKTKQLNFSLIFVTLILVVFGIVMVYSASCYSANILYGNDKFFMNKQIVGAVIGVFAMAFFTLFDYHKLEKIKWIILAVSIVLLALVFVPGIGFSNNGATRWIRLLGISIQPSEIAKFAFVVWTSSYLAKNYDYIKTFKGILPVLFVGVIYCITSNFYALID